MAGLETKFALEDAGLEAELAGLIARGGNLKPAFDDIGQDMVAITTRAFELSQSPLGEAWTPSKAARREGRKTLIKTTNLMGSFSYVVYIGAEDGVAYGTNVPYASYLQDGGHVGEALAEQFGLGLAESPIMFPARPFVGASDTDIARWADTLRDYIAGPEGGAA